MRYLKTLCARYARALWPRSLAWLLGLEGLLLVLVLIARQVGRDPEVVLPKSERFFLNNADWPLFLAAVGLILGTLPNFLHAWIVAHFNSRIRASKTFFSNHDLSKAVGQSLRLILLDAADPQPGDGLPAVTSVAAKDWLRQHADQVPDLWSRFVVKEVPNPDSPYNALFEENLWKFVEKRGREKRDAPILEQGRWRHVLEYLNGGNPLPFAHDAAAMHAIEERLNKRFGEALWEYTKDDFVNGGAESQAMNLLIASQLLQRTTAMAKGIDGLSTALKDLADEWNKHKDAVERTLRRLEKGQRWALRLLKNNTEALDRIEATLRELINIRRTPWQELSTPEDISRAYQRWAAAQPPLSIVFDGMPINSSVPSPLIPAWRDFLDQQPWHEKIRKEFAILSQKAEHLQGVYPSCRSQVQSHLDAVKAINWDHAYQTLLSQSLDISQAFLRLLNSISSTNKGPVASSLLVDALESAQRSALHLLASLKAMTFGRCFLVAGSDGSGKSYFLDTLLRRAVNNASPGVVVLPVDWRAAGVPLEQAVIHQIEKVFGIRQAGHIEDVAAHFAQAHTRLVIAIDDLHRCVANDPNRLDEVTRAIELLTTHRNLLWIVSVNNICFDTVTTRSPFWRRYGHTLSVTEVPLQHSGWHLLDDINAAAKVGHRLVASSPAAPDSGWYSKYGVPFLTRHLSSPLIALITLKAHSHSLPVQQDIDFIAVIAEFWKCQLQNMRVNESERGRIKPTVNAIAKVAGERGSFGLPRAAVEEAILGERFVSLEVLRQVSLISVDRIEPDLGFQQAEFSETVSLEWELLWAHQCAVEIEFGFSQGRTHQKTFKRCVEDALVQCAGWDSWEMVCEHVLLLVDRRAAHSSSFQGHKDTIWSLFLKSDVLPCASVYFAATRLSNEQQKKFAAKLGAKKGPDPEHRREVFALMYFCLWAQPLDLKQVLLILHRRTRLNDLRFKRVADANLGDYFLLVLKRKATSASDLQSLPECLRLLDDCHNMGVAQQAASLMWACLFEQVESDADTVIEIMTHYLALSSASDLERGSRDREPGGEPKFFREWLLSSAFEFLLQRQRVDELFAALCKLGWFGKVIADVPPGVLKVSRECAHQCRKYWALQSGRHYSRSSVEHERTHFRELVGMLINSNREKGFNLAYFMIRHTGELNDEGVRLVERELYDTACLDDDRFKQLKERHPIAPVQDL